MTPASRRAVAALLLAASACAAPGSSPAPAPAGGGRSAGGALQLPAPAPPPGARPLVLVLVSVAGMEPSHYRGSGAARPWMPTVAALAAAGVSADAVEAVAPATKYPAHATLLTGRTPARHGITADLLIGRNGVRATRYWHASHLKAETLWQLVANSRRGVASLGWPSTVGASIPILLPDVVPTRRGQSWLEAAGDATTPAILEAAKSAGGTDPATDHAGPARDRVLVELACRLLSAPEPPVLLLLHLSQTEPAIVAHGPDSAETQASFAAADRDVARLLGCLDGAGHLASSAIAVVGDHGTAPVHTLIEPNAVLAHEGLLEASNGNGDGVRSWKALVRTNGGSAFVYAESDAAALQARGALEDAAFRTGVFRVVTARDMLAVGADPSAWFGLEAEPGFAFGNAPREPLLRAAAQRGVGGYLPPSAEMSAGFVAWGRGLRSGIRIPKMRQTDVAPTLAPLLGVELPENEGRELVGVLSLSAQ